METVQEYDVSIVINPNFKQLIKDDKDFDDKIKKLQQKISTQLSGRTDKQTIKIYLYNYINLVNMLFIKAYYDNPENIQFWEDKFQYNNQLLNNPDYSDLSQIYADFFQEFYILYSTLAVLKLVENLYRNKDKIKGTELDKSLVKYTGKTITETFNEYKFHYNFSKWNIFSPLMKQFEVYDNTNFKHKVCIDFPFEFLMLEVCPNDKFKNYQICRNGGVIQFYNELADKYRYKANIIEKLNDKYFYIFTTLYLINSHKTVCNIRTLINSDSTTIDDIINDINIEISVSNPITFISHKNSVENFFTIQEKTKECGMKKERYTIKYNKHLKSFINTCLKNKKFIIIQVIFIFETTGHANILVYNPNTNEVEIFEPRFDKKYHTNPLIFKEIMEQIFPSHVKYVYPNSYITHNIQDLQEKEICTVELGHCASWSLWYVDKRLNYPTLTAKQAFEKIVNKYIINITESKELSELIANYVQYIKKQRVTVLNNPDIDPKTKELLSQEWGIVEKKMS